METVLKNVTAGVISIDKSGVLTTVNTSAERLLQISPGKVLGKNFREVFPHGDAGRFGIGERFHDAGARALNVLLSFFHVVGIRLEKDKKCFENV